MRVIKMPRRMSMARLLRVLAAAHLEAAVLHVPKRARAFKERIDLDLLFLYTREHRLDLYLVTPDRRLRRRAAGAGLRASAGPPDEADLEAPEVAAARSEETLARNPPSPFWLLIGLAFLGGLGAFLLFWPRPAVVVTAARQQLTMEAHVLVSPSFRDRDIPLGQLPADTVTKTDLVVVELAATGSRVVGATPAKGEIVLINDGDERLAVPEGTAVQSAEGIRYLTTEAVSVPAAKRDFLLEAPVGVSSGQIKVQVVAEQPGTQGNLGGGKITALSGPLGRLLRVVNPEPLQGGTDRLEPVVTEDDVERAQLEARRQMELGAAEGLRAQVDGEHIFLGETIAVTPGRPVITPKAGETGASVRVTLPYNARCLAISRHVLGEYLASVARHDISPYFLVAQELFTLETLSVSPKSLEEAELNTKASYTAFGRLNRGRILSAVEGRGEEEARQALLALPEVASVQIDLPAGGSFPRFGWLIRLVLQRQDEG